MCTDWAGLVHHMRGNTPNECGLEYEAQGTFFAQAVSPRPGNLAHSETVKICLPYEALQSHGLIVVPERKIFFISYSWTNLVAHRGDRAGRRV